MAEMEITRNERVVDANGADLGRVVHVIVDGATRQVTDLVVERDGNEMTMPLTSFARNSGNTLMLVAPASQAVAGTRFDRAAYHGVDEDEMETMPERRAAGGATLEDVTRDSARIAEPGMTATTAPAASRQVASQPPVPRKATRTIPAAQGAVAREGEEITVPVVEERLTAGVREREAGHFRLVKSVRQEQQSIDVPLQHEEVYVTETATRRPATPEDLATLDRDIDVPIRDQEAVVSKEARVTGEVGVRKETVTETQRVSDTVRREEVHVEGADNARIHTEGNLRNLSADQRRQYDAMSEMDRTRYGRFTDAERAQYDTLRPEQRQQWVADWDRRNPIEKAVDKATGRSR